MNRIMRAATVFLAGLGLLGCQTASAPPPIPASLIEKTQADIARQLAVYAYWTAQDRKQIVDDKVEAEKYWCGAGRIDFDIASVKVDLVTTVDDTGSVSGSVSPSFGPGETITPKYTGSKESINTQDLTYTVYSLGDYSVPAQTPAALQTSQIAQVIYNERKALIDSALRSKHTDPQGCMTDFNPAKPTDANSTIQLAIKDVSEGNGNLTVALAILNFSVGEDIKNTNGSTITVDFRQTGLDAKSYVAPCDEDEKQPCVFSPADIYEIDAPKQPIPAKSPAAFRFQSYGAPGLITISDTIAAKPAPKPAPASGEKKCRKQTLPGVWVPAPCGPGAIPVPDSNGQCTGNHSGTMMVGNDAKTESSQCLQKTSPQ